MKTQVKLEQIGTGAAKVGRTGVKLHRAILMQRTYDDGSTGTYWAKTCSCGAVGKAIQYFPNVATNCGA